MLATVTNTETILLLQELASIDAALAERIFLQDMVLMG